MDDYRVSLGAILNANAKGELQKSIDAIKDLSVKVSKAELSPDAINHIKKQLTQNGIDLKLVFGNTNQFTNQAKQIGQQAGQQIAQGIQNAVSNSNGAIKAFSGLIDKMHSTTALDARKIINLDGIANYEATLKNIKNTFAEFGQVKITNKVFNGEELQSFKVNIEQVNGELKETRSFIMSLSDNKTSFVFPNDVIKGSEKYVQHLNQAKNATNATGDALNALVKDQANANRIFSEITKTAKQLNSLTTKQTRIDPQTNPEQWRTLSAQIDEVGTKYNKLLGEFWSKPKNFEFITADDLSKLNALGYTLDQVGSKMRDNLAAKTGKIQLQFETGNYESKVESLIAKTQKWTDANGNARINTTALRDALNNLNVAYNAVTASGGNTEANQKALIKAEQALSVEIKKTTNEINLRNAQFASSSQIDTLRQRYQEFYDKNTAAHRKWGAQLKAGMAELASGTELPIQKANQLEKELIDIQNAARQAGKLGLSFFDRLKQGMSSFSYWTSSTSMVMTAIRGAKDMVGNVKDIDTAMINLQKVTNETSARYDKFLDSASTKAKELGRSVSSLVEQTAEWAKRGYSLSEAEELATTSSIYANVGEVDDVTAVEDITTAMKAFNIEAEDSIYIVDMLNNLGNKYATSSANLGEGLRVSASALQLAGNDIQQTLAMITGGTEITQNASEMGNAIKVMSMRIRGMKGELEELGEEAEGIESVSKIQTQILNSTHGKVNIFGDNGEFRATYDIIEDIAEVYDTLKPTEQASLIETIAGKQRGNQIAALIQSFQSGQAQNAYEDAVDSSGSAMQEQERWLGSLDAKTQQFEASWESLSNTFLDSGLLKGLVELGTTGVNALEGLIKAVGSLGAIGIGAGIFAGVKNFDSIKNWLNTTKTATGAISGITYAEDSATIALYNEQLKGLTLTQQKLALSTSGLNAEQQKYILSKVSESATVGAATAASLAELTVKERELLISMGIITADQLETTGTIVLTEAQKQQILTSTALSEIEKQRILNKYGIVSATTKEVTTTNLLGGVFGRLKDKIKTVWAATEGMGGTLKRVGGTMKTLWGDMSKLGKIAIAAAVVIAVNELFSMFTDTTEEIKTKIEEAKQRISETESEISSLDSQISETENLIQKMKDAGADDKTIETYEKEKELLEQQKKILEEIIEDERIALAGDSARLINNQGSQSGLSKMIDKLKNFDIIGSTKETPIVGGLLSSLDKDEYGNYGGYRGDLQRGGLPGFFAALRDDLVPFGNLIPKKDPANDIVAETSRHAERYAKAAEEYAKSTGDEQRAWKDVMVESQKYLNDHVPRLIESRDAMSRDNADGIYNEEIKKATEAITAYYKAKPDIAIELAFGSIGGTESDLGNSIYEAYTQGGKVNEIGKIISEKVSKDSETFKQMVEYGLIDESDTDWAKNLATEFVKFFVVQDYDTTGLNNAYEEAKTTIDELKKASEGIESLGSAFEEFSNDGYITTETLNNIKESLNLTEDEWEKFYDKITQADLGAKDLSSTLGELYYTILQNQFDGVGNSLAATQKQLERVLAESGIKNAKEMAAYYSKISKATTDTTDEDNNKVKRKALSDELGIEAKTRDTKVKNALGIEVEDWYYIYNGVEYDKLEDAALAAMSDGGVVPKFQYDVEIVSEASGGISTLASAYKEINDEGYITTDTIASIREAVGENIENWEQYENVLYDAEAGSAEFNQALSELTYKIIENKLASIGLENATEQQIAAILRENGVANADALAIEYLRIAKVNEAIATYNGTQASYDSAVALINESLSAEEAKMALNQLELAKINVNNAKITSSDDIDNIIAIANAALASEQTLRDLARAKAELAEGFVGPVSESTKAIMDGVYNFDFDKLDPGDFKIAAPIYTGGDGSKSSGSSQNKPDHEDSTDAIINRINLRADELEQQEKEIQNLTEIAKLEKDYKKQISLENDLLDVHRKRVKELNSANVLLHNEAEFLRSNNPWDEASWFNSQGEATEAYYTLFNSSSKEQQERIADLFDKLSKYKKAYTQNADEILSLNKEIMQTEERIVDLHNTMHEDTIRDIEHARDMELEQNPYADTTSYYKQMQDEYHTFAELLRSLDPEKYKEEIQELQKAWWDAQNSIEDWDWDNSNRWIEDRNFYNDWDLYGDSEVEAWERVYKRYSEAPVKDLEKINEAQKNLFEARKTEMDKSIQDIADYITARNAYNDWDAYGDSEVKAIQRQTKIIEKAYRDRLLSYEEYADKLEEQSQRIYSLAQEEINKNLSNIDKYISARNHYDDWEEFGDSEINAIKRQIQYLDAAYKQKLISYEEYTEKVAEYTQKIYSVAKDNIIEEVSKLVEDYEEMKDLESSQIESQKTLLQSYYDVTNAVTEAQHEINKELKASMTMHEYLNEETRELLFNQEDYNALNEKLLDIQFAADELQKQYQEDILNANAETIAEITSQYEMQYETMMKQYEIAKAELEVAKKRQQLDNVLAERNTRMFINGQWQWVAKTQDVINAQNELAEAEIERKKQEASLEQTEAINDFTSQINAIETDLAQVRKYWEDAQEMLNGELDDVAEALKQISEVSSPELKRVVDATGGTVTSFSDMLSESTTAMSDIIDGEDRSFGIMADSIGDIIRDLKGYSDAIRQAAASIDYATYEKDTIDRMKANSEKWHTASEKEREDLERENQRLGNSIDADYDSETGKWYNSNGKLLYSVSSSSGGSSSPSSNSSSSSKQVNTTDQYVKSSNGNIQSNPNWDGKKKGGVGSFYKYAEGTRYTAGGLTALGEKEFEAYITNSGRLIPINQPTVGNIGAGGVVFNREQLANLRNLWDLSNLGKISPFVSSSNVNSQSTVIDNSIHINGLTVGEQGNEDWINGLRRYVATHK